MHTQNRIHNLVYAKSLRSKSKTLSHHLSPLVVSDGICYSLDKNVQELSPCAFLVPVHFWLTNSNPFTSSFEQVHHIMMIPTLQNYHYNMQLCSLVLEQKDIA